MRKATITVAADLVTLVGSTPGDYRMDHQLHKALCDANRVLRGQGRDLDALAHRNIADQLAQMRLVLVKA